LQENNNTSPAGRQCGKPELQERNNTSPANCGKPELQERNKKNTFCGPPVSVPLPKFCEKLLPHAKFH